MDFIMKILNKSIKRGRVNKPIIKSKIPDWESLYNYTKDYFEESGLDTKKELYGLDL